MSNTKLNVEELNGFLKYVISNNKSLQTQGKIPVAVNVEGVAGIGKTSMILQLCEELDMQHVKINLSQLEELGDLIGFPCKEFEMKRADGIIKWVPETIMNTYIANKYMPTGEKRMAHAAPEWVQGLGENGILILDDFTRALPTFMQATMELLDRQEYISWKLPKGWNILLSTNPDNGDYSVSSLDIAQKTRFISTELRYDSNVWARWAEKANIDK